MKKSRVLFGLLGLLAAGPLVFGNGLNLNGLGSRAVTMAGAFVGLADDFSALFWNPAGIAFQNNKAFGFYGTGIIPTGTFKLDIPLVGNVVDAKTQSKTYLAGMAGYIHPINDRLVAGIGVYTPAGLGASWESPDLAYLSGDRKDIEWTSKVGLLTIAPTLAYRVADWLALGAQLNINYGMFDISMYAGKTAIPIPPYTFDMGQYMESETGWGVGATFSALVKACPWWAFGIVYRTASTISFSGDAEISSLKLLGFPGTSAMKREVTWPEWLAWGVAVYPSEKLTFTFDVQWTKWNRLDEIKTDYTDPVWANLMQAGGKDVMPLYWENRNQFRLGAEYKINPSLALRAGYYLDPAPAPDRTMNILLPNYDFNGLTFGLGYNLGNLQIDFGAEYLIGKERSIDPVKVATDPKYAEAMPGRYNMKIFVPNLSISYKF